MTQQYIVGELSLLLARLQEVATDHDCSGRLARLRCEAECTHPSELGVVVRHALALADRLCCASLERGDVAAFIRQTAIASELSAFASCAGLTGSW